MRDQLTGTTYQLPLVPGGGEPDDYTTASSFSSGARGVAFSSSAPNILGTGRGGTEQVLLRDMQAGRNDVVSASGSGAYGGARSWWPRVSSDGSAVSFVSSAGNLVTGDTNNIQDVFVYDAEAREVERVSLSACGGQSNGYESSFPEISGNGSYVAFESYASDLVTGDTNSTYDIFVRDRFPSMTGCGSGVTLPAEQTFGPQIGGSVPHAANPTGEIMDPVNTATGSYTTTVVDLALPGPGLAFELRRSYTSADASVGPMGKGWTFSYGASLSVESGGRVRFRSETGQQLLFTSNPDGTFARPTGARSKLESVAGGYRLSRTDGVAYAFDGAGHLTSMTDLNGQSVALTYDAGGLLVEILDTAGRAINVSHNAAGEITEVSLPDGRSVHYGYSGGLLRVVTDARGNDTTYTYDGARRLIEVVDPNGHTVVRNVYDSGGRVIQQFDARGFSIAYGWDPASQTASATDARGNVWKDRYQGNVLVSREDPLGNITSLEYDRNLNLTGVTDPLGHTTSMRYDSRGNLLRRTAPAPLSYEDRWTYDAANRPLSHTDPLGRRTSFTYDASENLIQLGRPDGANVVFTREAGTGLVLSETDARGNTTLYGYDEDGNRTSVTTPLGNRTTMEYDGSGRLVTLVDPIGNAAGHLPENHRWRYAYDASNHVVSLSDPLGHVTRWSYDPAGNRTGATDPNGHTVGYGYDEANHLTSVVAPDQTSTSYAYDAVGNLIGRTDPKGHVTSYRYDPANRLDKVTNPLGAFWTYGYDAGGHLTSVVDANGNSTLAPDDGITRYTYDPLARVTAVDAPGTAADATWDYDAAGNVMEMNDALGAETYTYDALDRLTRVARGGSAFSYVYNPTSGVTSRTYADGTVTTSTFDADGRIASVAADGATTTYGYDENGGLLTTALPAGNGYREVRSYDRVGRLAAIENRRGSEVLSAFTYSRDPAGNPTQVTGTGESESFTYDLLDRLTSVCYGSAGCDDPGTAAEAVLWTYDAVGNRLTQDTRGPSGVRTTSYTYDAGDELLQTTGSAGSRTFGYDANGNMTHAGDVTYAYDGAGRMTRLMDGSGTTTYAYDGRGNRISSGSEVAGLPVQTTTYDWDIAFPLPRLASERAGPAPGPSSRTYINGIRAVSMKTPATTAYYHYDGLGSVTNVTDANGLPQWSHSYDPFGNARSATKVNPLAPDNPMRFTGEYLDPTGLYHLRARQYEPSLGRFTATDPWPVSRYDPYVASYVYVNNRPTVLIDPSGLCGWTDPFDCVADVAGVVSTAASVVAVGAGVVAVGAVVVASAPVSLAVGATALGVSAVAGSVAATASGVSLGASAVGTAAEIADGGGFDDCFAYGAASTTVNAGSYVAGKLAQKSPGGVLLANIIGLEGSLAGQAGGSLCSQPTLGVSSK